MKLLRLIKTSIAIFAILAGVNVCFSLLTAWANGERAQAYKIRQNFIQAGHELRVASLELTRLARYHIVMGMDQYLEAYWETLLVADRLGSVRQLFVDHGASPSEMYLLDRALAYQRKLRAIDAQAIEARAGGEYLLALDITYSSAYAAYGAAFVGLVNELNGATFARTQEMVERAERNASLFEILTIAAVVLLGATIIFGTAVILREVRETMRRERDSLENERETADLIQTILDSSPLAIGVWNSSGDLIIASQQTAEMFGVSDPKDFTGERFYGFSPECQSCGAKSRETYRSFLEEAYRNGHARFEWMHLTKDGEPLPTEVSVRRFDRKGKDMLVSYTVSLREIKAAMEKEREANELNQMYLDACPMFIEIWDDGVNLIDCNEKTCEFFGLSDRREYTARHKDFSPEFQACGMRSAEKSAEIVAKTLKDGYAHLEWMHRKSNGEPLPVDTTFVRLRRGGKSIAVGYSYDLRPIRAAEGLTRKLLDSSPLLMEFWDADGNMLDCNQKMQDLFEVGKAEFAERFFDFSAAIQPCGMPAQEKNEEMIKHAMAGGLHRAEWMFILPSGEELPTETTWAHIMHQGKSMIVVYSQDLRMVKAAIKKEQRAEEESLAKTRFLAHMSHEIRTPMNAILGIAEIQLQKDEHPPEIREAFSRIHNSSKLLLNIVNDILDLSRVVAGKMEIIPEVYGVASLIVDTVQLNHMHIGSKEIELRLSVDPRIPAFLIGDGLRIKQVLNNLLSNSLKYTLEGTVTMSLGMEASGEPDGLTLVIAVSDTGQGMTKKQIDSLFQEFSRFNLQINRSIEGSGLGMPITYSLIKLMQGDITVESEPGKGSSFTVRLPQKRHGDGALGEEAAANLHDMETYKAALEKGPKRSPELMPYGKVLVVDDVDINLYVAEGILASYKIAVETAASGPEAISKIKNGGVYDIIFMDHMMPGMDGLETAKIIHSMGYNRPIVALTANALKDMEKMFMENGFSGFVSKPIDVDKLDMYLKRFIRDKQNQMPPAEHGA